MHGIFLGNCLPEIPPLGTVPFNEHGVVGGSPGGLSFPQQPSPTPQALGAFCYTQFGRFGPGPVLPQGNPCYVQGPQGPILGRIGP